MVNPILPIQSGANLPGLENEQNVKEAAAQDAEMDYYEDALGLEPGDVEEEIIELEDGSVVINYQEKQSPRKNPEFYENLAESFDEGTLQALAAEYLDLIDVDKESRSQRDKQYEEGLRRTK